MMNHHHQLFFLHRIIFQQVTVIYNFGIPRIFYGFTRQIGNLSSDFQPIRFQNRSSFRRFRRISANFFQNSNLKLKIPKLTDADAGARRMLLASVKQL